MVTRIGTNNPDRLDGSQYNDLLSGLGGNDILFGYAGNDQLFGGLGDDHLFAHTGNDTLTGGPGLDNFYFGDGTNNWFGNDTIKDFSLSEGDTIRVDGPGQISQGWVIDSGISTTLVFSFGTIELPGVTTGLSQTVTIDQYNSTAGYEAIDVV